jgi:penicillin-binding protein 1A
MKRRGKEPEIAPEDEGDAALEQGRGQDRRARPRRNPVDAFFIGVAKFAFWGFLLSALTTGGGLLWLSKLSGDMPETAFVTEQPRRPSIVVLDRLGREIARRGPFVARDVTVEELPDYLVDAVLAVEDRRFYEHNGVDVRGLARAAWENLRAGRVVQGGSTLTQQLAKNVFLDGDRTLERKAREALLATWIERHYTKDEILELYLNRVYFGAGAWGVEAASQRYFGKPASRVTLGEAALLAGLLKAPSRYSPTNDPDLAADRATVVLGVMAEADVITEAQRDAALDAPVEVLAGGSGADRGSGWFVDWVIADAQALVGSSSHDLIVQTTLDLDAQEAASRVVTEGLAAVTDKGAEQAALVALDGDGAVRAMIGGRSYSESQFNRAVQARRQPGSAFKPFVYAAAIEAGLSPWDVRLDAPIQLGDWSPQNFDEEFQGNVTLIRALADSINTVAVRVAEEIGRERVVRLVKRLGLDSRIRATRSMALGSHEVSPIELTGAYAAFANGGFAVEPYAITRIDSLQGEALWRRPPTPVVRGLDERTARLMNVMLARVVTEGTGKGAALPGRPAAGKTGTTNDFRDAWFMGYVPGFVAGVWVGADDSSPMARVTGGALPASIWRSFMTEALEGEPVTPLDLAPEPTAPALQFATEEAPAVLDRGGLDQGARGELEALLGRIQGL